MTRDVKISGLRSKEDHRSRNLRLLDTLAWLVGSSALLLLLLPVGYVSGDTVPLAVRLAEGTWLWNPNRLLMEPTALLWLHLLNPLRLDLSLPDQLTMLSMLSGTVSIAVVRGWIVPRVATRRWIANFATAWFALGSAWSIVLLYGYPVMLQMPFLVLMVALLLRTADGENLPLLAIAGVAGGVAALAWISNALIVAGLGVGVSVLAWQRHGPKAAATSLAVFGGSSILALVLPLALVWNQVVVTDLGFLSWLRSYGGGVDSQIAEVYGLKPGLISVAMAVVRTGYGAAMAVVDLSPLAAWVRGAEIDGVRIGARIIAFVMGSATLLALAVGVARRAAILSRVHIESLVIITAFVVPVVIFGFLWDNSDDKFYFQLAIPLSIAVGTLDWWWSDMKRPLLVAATIPLFFNAFDVMDRFILYDRDGKVSALAQAYERAELVVMPGYDDVFKLSYSVPQRGEMRRPITWFADLYPAEEGLQELRRMLSASRDSCGRVVIVDIMGGRGVGNPWNIIGPVLGYTLESVQQAIYAELPGLEIYEQAGFTFATWPGVEQEESCVPRPLVSEGEN